MAHIGAICFPATGHLNPLTALLRALQRRGHKVTVFQIQDVEKRIRAAGIEYQPIGAASHPAGTLASLDQALSQLSGIAALRFTLSRMKDSAAMILRDAPAAVKSAGIDLLIVDQAECAGGTVAERVGIPFATVIFFPPVLRDRFIPPFNFGWRYRTDPISQFRNALGNAIFYRVARPTLRLIGDQRRAWGLPPRTHADDLSSASAQIAQMPAVFDFPRHRPAPNLHYTGPFVDPATRPPVDFPWDKLDTGPDARPLVYGSMGTLQNGVDVAFRRIAQACAELKSGRRVQLVLSLGGGLDPTSLGPLPGDPIVVRFAPQLELLRRCALTITHAGLNTTLESLSQGVPMVAIPVGNDQPGVAARIEWSGTGRAIPLRRATVPRLRTAIDAVLSDPSYRAAARQMQQKIAEIDGLERAADHIESALPAAGAGAA